MYKNAGRIIKEIVKITVVLGMVLSIAVGTVVAVLWKEYGFVVGLLVAIVGCVLSWLSGLLFYAFGEMADSLLQIKRMLAEIKQSQMSYDEE